MNKLLRQLIKPILSFDFVKPCTVTPIPAVKKPPFEWVAVSSDRVVFFGSGQVTPTPSPPSSLSTAPPRSGDRAHALQRVPGLA